jgi:hypothetical protein
MKPNWKIQQLKRIDATGLIIEARYSVSMNQNGVIVSHLDKVQLEGDSNDPNFIPYNDLTEQIVLDWVKQKVDVETIETQILEELTVKQASKPTNQIKTGLPWRSV